MCSQDCLEKIKIVCLNTVQVLFKDAFDKFSTNMLNRNNNELLNLLNSTETTTSYPKAIKSLDDQNDSNNEANDHSSIQNYPNELNDKQLSTPKIKFNSQLVLCNLMQNLVDAINEQCIKQLPLNQIKSEKKKRKRKRKRKKLKSNESIENEQKNSAVNEQMKQTEISRNEQFKVIDKIVDNGNISSNISLKGKNSKHEFDLKTSKHITLLSKYNLNKNIQSTSSNSNAENDDLKNKKNEVLCTKSPSSSTSLSPSNLLQNYSNKNYHSQQHKSDDKCLKRKRDNSPTYKDRRRITSARKRPILYRRKRFSSSSSSCSEDSFSSKSSSASYSSSDEFTKQD